MGWRCFLYQNEDRIQRESRIPIISLYLCNKFVDYEWPYLSSHLVSHACRYSYVEYWTNCHGLHHFIAFNLIHLSDRQTLFKCTLYVWMEACVRKWYVINSYYVHRVSTLQFAVRIIYDTYDSWAQHMNVYDVWILAVTHIINFSVRKIQ